MERINAQHVSEPGLVVLDITAADEATAQAVMVRLEQRWADGGAAPRRMRAVQRAARAHQPAGGDHRHERAG
ncbi:DUF6207 family protein, partial [Streptomyces sp. NPDC056638]|uniref:DUF6207 family protein n=1 Tax=Streptomyces sp. NPDC056638 TaxID=3345887 RepID=UPI0036B490E3